MTFGSSISKALHAIALVIITFDAGAATQGSTKHGAAAHATSPMMSVKHAASAHTVAGKPAKPSHQTALGPGKIDIRNFSFMPATITVTAGSSVTWTNNDSEPHTIASADNSFAASPGMDTGDNYKAVFRRPGVYKYFCTIHPSMVGTIVVK